MRKYTITLLVFMAAGLCRADIPKLFTQRGFTSVTLVDAVNHFVAIGQDASVKEFQEIIANEDADTNWLFSRGFSAKERIGWVCRILFESKDGSPLRPPEFGRLNLPQKFMPADKWPLYPVALSGSTYFVLSEGYSTDGMKTESAADYVAYCEKNGVFRKTSILMPTKDEANKDAQALRQGAAWQSISWEDDQGFSYPLGERWAWGFMLNQIRSLPDKAPVQDIATQQPQTGTAAKNDSTVKSDATVVSAR